MKRRPLAEADRRVPRRWSPAAPLHGIDSNLHEASCLQLVTDRAGIVVAVRRAGKEEGRAQLMSQHCRLQPPGERRKVELLVLAACLSHLETLKGHARPLRRGQRPAARLILAVTRVAGELGASAALASGQGIEELLGELAAVLQQAGRDHHEVLQALALPVAGSA